MRTAEVVTALEAAEVPAGPVFDLEEVFADPQARHLGLRKTLQHPTGRQVSVTGFPWRFSETPAEIRYPPPQLGQHTDEALSQSRLQPGGHQQPARARRDRLKSARHRRCYEGPRSIEKHRPSTTQ